MSASQNKKKTLSLGLALIPVISMLLLLIIGYGIMGLRIEPLLPWTSAGVYMATTLGVSTLDLLPWAIQCYAAIFFALIYGFSGVGIARTASASEKSPQTSVTK